MNYVEPIRSPEKIRDITEYLKRQNPRNYIMWMLGLYTGLRISDVLRLKVADVKDWRLNIRDKKTGKQSILPFNPLLKRAVKEYIINMNDDEYLIESRKIPNQPITRVQAYNILKDVSVKFGIPNIGTHSLRKTFGYHYYKKTKDLALLKEIFNHSHISITLKYIGIVQDDKAKAFMGMKYY